jgi:hypothetical protein
VNYEANHFTQDLTYFVLQLLELSRSKTPNKWMVYIGQSENEMDENWGYPHDFGNPQIHYYTLSYIIIYCYILLLSSIITTVNQTLTHGGWLELFLQWSLSILASHEDFFVDRLEQHMSSEWAPMSIRAAVQSRGGYDVKKFSKRLGGLVQSSTMGQCLSDSTNYRR